MRRVILSLAAVYLSERTFFQHRWHGKHLEKNGAASLQEMRKRIAYYRHQADDPREDYTIGCRILTQPFFMPEKDWSPIPASWSPHIQQGRTYSTAEQDGRHLWDLLMERISQQPDIANRCAPIWRANADSSTPRSGGVPDRRY
jgi:hypothetical protein